jgi:DNA-binding transcriptional ArsR family regulator
MTIGLDSVIHAISDPTRRAIIERLAKGPARVTDVAAAHTRAMSLAAVSKHVKVLERAGLVRRAVNGREHTLELEAAPLRDVVRWASSFEQFWTERLDRLEAFFAKRNQQE